MTQETNRQRTARLRRRDQYRTTVCVGCRHNYYNFPKPQNERGDVVVADDYSCWFIGEVNRGKCPQKS